MVDGASGWQRFRYVTLPAAATDPVHRPDPGPDRWLADLRPDLHGNPGRPRGHNDLARVPARTRPRSRTRNWGQGAAIGFIVFVIIIIFTILQRIILRERKVSKRRMRLYNLPPSARDGGDAGGEARCGIATGIAAAAQVNRQGGGV